MLSLALLFIIFAIENVSDDGEWGLFTMLLVIFATFDFGSGIHDLGHILNIKIKKTKNEPLYKRAHFFYSSILSFHYSALVSNALRSIREIAVQLLNRYGEREH